ncbi:MAG: thiamine diphosphokinase [Clostridiales bacterium]|nr:thiamine diphosphokinase [Clostridiales bacterium]
MLYLIVAGGPLPDAAAKYIKTVSGSTEDRVIICCDGGADFLARFGIVPDMVVGDMDSITPEGLEFIAKNNIFTERYPVEKDWTDTEIALGKAGEDAQIILVCPLAGRIDHVIANLSLVLKMKSQGRDIKITDGITTCYPLCGEDSVVIDVSSFDEPVAVSLIPWNFTEPVKGVTTKGLYYPLEDKNIEAGSSYTFSNKPDGKTPEVSVFIRAGLMFVVTTIAN